MFFGFRFFFLIPYEISIPPPYILCNLNAIFKNNLFAEKSRDLYCIICMKYRSYISQHWKCLKITENVSYNIASDASYVYILIGQKLIKNTKKPSILPSFWGQTVLSDKSILIWQKLVESVKIEVRHFGWFSNIMIYLIWLHWEQKRFGVWLTILQFPIFSMGLWPHNNKSPYANVRYLS